MKPGGFHLKLSKELSIWVFRIFFYLLDSHYLFWKGLQPLYFAELLQSRYTTEPHTSLKLKLNYYPCYLHILELLQRFLWCEDI